MSAAVALVLAPAAAADPESPSNDQGRQAINEQVFHYHVQLKPSDDDFHDYCQQVLVGVLKTGKLSRVDSKADFIRGCQEEGRALLASSQ